MRAFQSLPKSLRFKVRRKEKANSDYTIMLLVWLGMETGLVEHES